MQVEVSNIAFDNHRGILRDVRVTFRVVDVTKAEEKGLFERFKELQYQPFAEGAGMRMVDAKITGPYPMDFEAVIFIAATPEVEQRVYTPLVKMIEQFLGLVPPLEQANQFDDLTRAVGPHLKCPNAGTVMVAAGVQWCTGCEYMG